MKKEKNKKLEHFLLCIIKKENDETLIGDNTFQALPKVVIQLLLPHQNK